MLRFKRYNQNGQIFSIDALVALIIATLVLGITLQVMESQSYNLKQEQVFNEIKTIGHNAANLIVSLPESTCDLMAEDGITKLINLNNCIDSQKLSALTKDSLGIPTGYSCKIGNQTNNMATCNDDPSTATNVYSEKRIVLMHAGNVTRNNFNACFNGLPTCALKNEKNWIEVKLWK